MGYNPMVADNASMKSLIETGCGKVLITRHRTENSSFTKIMG